jgi:ferredoxin
LELAGDASSIERIAAQVAKEPFRDLLNEVHRLRQCSRYCQVGIDVMSFALKQEELNNRNSSCIGCGICVAVCPMDTLSFRPRKQ